jgi:hypothetical protein
MNEVKGVLIIMFCLLVVGIGMARAHQAESGWAYPIACCSGNDCYSIAEEEVKLVGGLYQIVKTGELFSNPDSGEPPAGARKWRWSGDSQFHRCSPSGQQSDQLSFCLFVPAPGV